MARRSDSLEALEPLVGESSMVAVFKETPPPMPAPGSASGGYPEGGS